MYESMYVCMYVWIIISADVCMHVIYAYHLCIAYTYVCMYVCMYAIYAYSDTVRSC